MKIFVISDTHGNLDKVYQVYKKLDNIDLIVHCGDYYRDAQELGSKLGIRVLAVKGNCDKSFDDKDMAFLETECGDILITHGHMQRVSHSQQSLYYLALEHDCIAAVYGHTHIPVSAEWEGVHLINPGSLSRPRDNSSGSFAIIDTDEYDLRCQIHYYDDFMDSGGAAGGGKNGGEAAGGSGKNGGGKSKVKGGHLRSLLNYSDRF